MRRPFLFIDESAFSEPEQTILGPGVAVCQTDPVAAVLVDMQVEENPCPAQGARKGQTVFHQDGLIFDGVPEEGGRGFWGDLEFVGEEPDQFLVGLVTQQIPFGTLVGDGPHTDHRVAKNSQVGSRTDPFNGITVVWDSRVVMRQKG